MAATLALVDRRLNQQMEENARRDLQSAGVRYSNQLVKHQEMLRKRFRSLANEASYQAALQALNADTVHNQLVRMVNEEGLADEGVRFVLYVPAQANKPKDGNPVIYQNDPQVSSPALELGAGLAAARALKGETVTDTIRVGEKLYNLVVLPIYDAGRQDVIGVLVFGEDVGWKTAEEFSVQARGFTVLMAGDQVVASTLPAFVPATTLASQFKELTGKVDPSNFAQPIIPLVIENEHFYCAASRFPSLKGDTELGYMLFSSYEADLQALHMTRMLLVGVCLLGIMLGTMIVWWFVERATQPLIELRMSAEAVSRGDFSRRVLVRSNDECGQLAVVFNQMVNNLQESLSELEQTVQTLETTQAQLVQSEKLSAVGEFVAGVAHELNNPLTAVMGFSELLQKADVDVKHRRYLEMIFKSSQRCQKIVQSLLSFARRQQPERKPVSINKLIDDILEIVAYHLRTSNIEVVVELDPHPPIILVDIHQIQQVLLNVINNARQAIEANQPSGRIKITTTATALSMRLVIEDNGPGISPANLKRIFDPFFTTKQVGKGTGLGLSLCYGLIKEHGGTITCTSEEGKGARFVIELPALKMVEGDTTRVMRSASESAATSNEGQGKKILVVDDEEVLLQMIRDELVNHGYTVKVALDGEAALRQIKDEHFDMAFFDWKMPGLNGRQIYEHLRAENSDLCQRIVFITGDVINEQMQQFLDREKRQCLPKPFTLVELRTVIKSTFIS
jgi:signal transduction histidine kinase